jgi:hypothetical protein
MVADYRRCRCHAALAPVKDVAADAAVQLVGASVARETLIRIIADGVDRRSAEQVDVLDRPTGRRPAGSRRAVERTMSPSISSSSFGRRLSAAN